MNKNPDIVSSFFDDLQSRIITRLTSLDPKVQIHRENFATNLGGFSRPRVLTHGDHIEKAAVQLSRSNGASLPEAASLRNPHLAGKPFAACSISVIVHSFNPHVPTTHMNLRFFDIPGDDDTWYFGGGFDLTPYLPYEEDVLEWHREAQSACGSIERYLRLKRQCDEYFYLNHRNEPRGVGGLFFDDWREGGFNASLDFATQVGETFLTTYSKIFERRSKLSWTAAEESWMLHRRGRYAEFNLIQDRGTRYGLQSGHRVESILASLPPRVNWGYPPQAPEHKDFQTRLDSFFTSNEDC